MSQIPSLSLCLLDDERIALLGLQTLLEQEEGVRIQCASCDIPEVLKSIGDKLPDALFVDIQMPEASGFEVVEKLPPTLPVIFVTASDAHAIRAFEVNALDYLVKPVNALRLRQSLQRLRSRKEPDTRKPLLGGDDLVCLPLDEGRLFISAHQIMSIESRTNYSRIYLMDSRQLIVKRSLNEWEKRLDPQHFFRINRRWIIQLAHVESIESKGAGCRIHMKSSRQLLSASRRKGLGLKKILKQDAL